MALNFPDSPAVNDTWVASNGVTYVWNGTMWAQSGSGGAVVSSFNTRSGAVTLSGADVTAAGGALLASPVFTGDPQAPTQAVTDNDTTIATTQFVQSAIASAGVGQTFYYDLTDNADVAGYKRMLLTPSKNAETTAAVTCTGTSDFPLAVFITDPGVPGAISYPGGTAYRRLYGMVSAGTGRFHLQIYVRTAAGGETLVRDELSPNFNNTTVALQEWLATPPTGGAMNTTDRIVNKIYAQRVTGATNVTVTLFTEGSTHASQIQTTIPPSASAPLSATPPLAFSGGVLSIDMTQANNNAGRNRLHNARFSVNQRTYVSGTALAAGAYAHDRWKAGAGGCTYTFTSTPPSTTVTITAGTLQQIIEAFGVEGGAYMLSWTGTAQGRVNAGSYAASPVAVTGLAANTAITVEFNAGTLGNTQLEAGSVATLVEKLDIRNDYANCMRFYQTGTVGQSVGAGTAAWGAYHYLLLPVTMRATPIVTTAVTTQFNCSGTSVTGLSPTTCSHAYTVTATGGTVSVATFTASADL